MLPNAEDLPAVTAGSGSHIITSGDRFTNALEINDLFEHESPVGQLYVKLKELGIQVKREGWIDEEGVAYVVDLALPVGGARLHVTPRHTPCEHARAADLQAHKRVSGAESS